MKGNVVDGSFELLDGDGVLDIPDSFFVFDNDVSVVPDSRRVATIQSICAARSVV